MHRYTLIFILLALLSFSPTASWAQRDNSSSSRSSGEEEQQDDSSTETPKTAKALQTSALGNLAAWRHKEAGKELEAARDEFGNTPEFETAWGYLLAEKKKLDPAIEKLTRAEKKATADPAPSYLLGEIQSWKRNKSAAKKAWTTAKNRAAAMLKNSPEDAEANYWMGAALLKLGKISDAGKYLEKARKADYAPAQTYLQVGLYYSAQKKWKDAKQAFDSCIEADNGFAHAYYYRARVLDKLGKKSEMLVDLDRFVKLAPDAREAAAARALLNNGG